MTERVWRCYDREMGRNEWTGDPDVAAIRATLPDEWVVHEFRAVSSALPPVAPAGDREAVALDAFDAGELNTYGGGNVGWWLDYIRATLGDAHDFYQEQVGTPPPAQPAEERAVVDAMWLCVEKATLPDSGYCCQDHLFGMLSRMRSFEKVGKFNRWLGYIQGVLVATNNGTVEQFKDMNRSPAALSLARTGSEAL